MGDHNVCPSCGGQALEMPIEGCQEPRFSHPAEFEMPDVEVDGQYLHMVETYPVSPLEFGGHRRFGVKCRFGWDPGFAYKTLSAARAAGEAHLDEVHADVRV